MTLSRNVSWHDIQRWKQGNSSHQTNGESDAEACLSESSADRRLPSRNCLEPQRRLFHPSNRFSACSGWTRCGLSITCQHLSQQVDIGVYVRSLKLGMLYMTSSFPLLHPKETFWKGSNIQRLHLQPVRSTGCCSKRTEIPRPRQFKSPGWISKLSGLPICLDI